MAFDCKKEFKELYFPPKKPQIVTVPKMQFFSLNGYVLDFSATRLHHEIYLSDPRKTSPDKLKTVIRHPVRKVK